MKAVDLKVGDMYAIVSSAQNGEPYNTTKRPRSYGTYRAKRPTKADVHSGIEAAPAKVLAVGKFRRRRVGGCEWEITDDHYMTTVKVAVVDVAATLQLPTYLNGQLDRKALPTGDAMIGYPAGLKLNSKKIVWTEGVVNAADIVMPWSDFLIRREEHAMEVFERKAQVTRLEEVDRQIKELSFKLVANGGLMTDHESVTVKTEMVSVYENGATRYTGVKRTQSRVYPIDGILQLEPLLAEMDELVRRLSCS